MTEPMTSEDWRRWSDEMNAAARALEERGFQASCVVERALTEEQVAGNEAFVAEAGGTPGFRMHPTIRARSLAFTGFRFQWAGQGLGGRIELASDVTLYRSSTRRRERWAGRWRVLDTVGAQSQVMVRFDEHGAASLAFRSVEGGEECLVPLALSLEAYFDLARATCGLWDWQRYFVAEAGSARHLDQVGELLGILADLTPPADVGAVARRMSPATQRAIEETWPELGAAVRGDRR